MLLIHERTPVTNQSKYGRYSRRMNKYPYTIPNVRTYDTPMPMDVGDPRNFNHEDKPVQNMLPAAATPPYGNASSYEYEADLRHPERSERYTPGKGNGGGGEFAAGNYLDRPPTGVGNARRQGEVEKNPEVNGLVFSEMTPLAKSNYDSYMQSLHSSDKRKQAWDNYLRDKGIDDPLDIHKEPGGKSPGIGLHAQPNGHVPQAAGQGEREEDLAGSDLSSYPSAGTGHNTSGQQQRRWDSTTSSGDPNEVPPGATGLGGGSGGGGNHLHVHLNLAKPQKPQPPEVQQHDTQRHYNHDASYQCIQGGRLVRRPRHVLTTDAERNYVSDANRSLNTMNRVFWRTAEILKDKDWDKK